MNFLAVDPLAVVAAAAVITAIGLLWRRLVLAQWTTPALLLPVVILALVTAYALGLVIAWSGIANPLAGAVAGLVLALGLIAPAMLHLSFFERRPVMAFRLGMLQVLIEMTVAGALLGGW